MGVDYKRVPGGWQARVRVVGPDGVRRGRKRTRPRKADLYDWVAKKEQELRSGAALNPEQTVGDLIDLYLARGLQELKGEPQRRQRVSYLEWWRDRIGRLDLVRATSPVIARHLDELDVKPSTWNRRKSALAAVYRFAIRRKMLTRRDDPTNGLHRRERNEHARWLTDEERPRLLAAAEAHDDLRLMIRIAMTTGLRKAEVLRIEWADIDFERGQIAVIAKGDKKRAAPLVTKCVRLLREYRRRRPVHVTGRVFGHCQVFPEKRWRNIRAEAGLEDFRWHDLRHTAASLFAQRGASLPQIAELLGCTYENVQRYAHLVSSDVADLARERLDDIAL